MAKPIDRKLAAILSADVVGYSRLMADDEAATIRTLSDYREEIAMRVRQHRGRVVDTPGDNVLAEFPTALDAVRAAVEIQGVLRALNTSLPAERRMDFRIGVHMGDIATDGDKVYGDGVNIAARLEALAEPGGICISDTVQQQVRDKVPLGCADLGEHEVKNLPHPVRVYRVEVPAEGAVSAAAIEPGSRWWIAVAAGVLLVAVAAAGWWVMTPGTAPASLPTAIVVLPFADMSPDGDQEYFADGMAEELINTLSKNADLRVVARTSAFAFKGKQVDIREIGEQLNVEAVVEGSVRKADDRLRITAQLVQVADGYHLWSETYDRKLDDVFEIQEEISHAISKALEVRLLGASKRPTPDLRAYELYLTGRFFWNQRTEEGFRNAIDQFEQALEVDPDYALAHVGLAMANGLLFDYGFDRSEAVLARATAATSRALAIDDSLGEAHASLGGARALQRDWLGAEAAYKRCLELSPGYAIGHQWYGSLLLKLGRIDDALQEYRRALELDPLASAINADAGRAYLFASVDYDAAIERFRIVRERLDDHIKSGHT